MSLVPRLVIVVFPVMLAIASRAVNGHPLEPGGSMRVYLHDAGRVLSSPSS